MLSWRRVYSSFCQYSQEVLSGCPSSLARVGRWASRTAHPRQRTVRSCSTGVKGDGVRGKEGAGGWKGGEGEG